MDYAELKRKQQKEFDDFPIGAAFSEKQFNEMMTEFGLEPKDIDKIYSIGAGCYIRKSDHNAFVEMTKRHADEEKQAIKEDSTGEGFIYSMFLYELDNHEYSYTHDADDAIYSLDLTWEQILDDPRLKRGLGKAIKEIRERV